MKLFITNTTATKTIKNFQTVTIKKEQIKVLKGGNGIISGIIEETPIEW